MVIILWLIGAILQQAVVQPIKAVAVKYEDLLRRIDNLTLERCSEHDLITISGLAAVEFGQYAASLERDKALFALDNQSYWKIVNGRGKIVGFYAILRLTKMGTRAAKLGEFDILTCPSEYIRRDKKFRNVSVYIGGVFGGNRRARAVAWGALNKHALEFRPTKMFARAASPDGLRLLKQAQFSPVQLHKVGLGALYRK